MMNKNNQIHKVPEGYKQTEVGVIPEDWETLALGELVTIRSGESPSKFKLLSEGVPYFKVEQLHNHSVYAVTTPYYVDKEFVSAISKGSIIFPKRGASIFANRIRVLKHDSFMDTNLMTLSCSPRLFYLYLFYQLNYIGLATLADTTSVPQINNKHINPFLIPLASLKEQTAIANALSDVDALIAELEKLIAKKEAIKTGAMQQLLTGRTRLPQFAKREDGTLKGYKQSELGEIPEDWEVVEIGSLLKIRHGKSQKQVEIQNGLYPILGTGGVIGTTNHYLCNKPSVLIGRKGTINKPVYIDKPFWTVDTLFYSEVEDIADARFVFYKFCMINWMEYNEASGVPSLNSKTIERVNILTPKTKEEQVAISKILSDMDSEIEVLEKRLEKTKAIKQGMMQELLTGRTRLV